MTDGEIVTAIIGAGGAIGTGVLTLGRWLGGIWRDIRREEIAAANANASAQRAESSRMVDAMLEQARSNATLAAAHGQLAGKIDGLSHQLDSLVERTPVDFEVPPTKPLGRVAGDRRARTNPQGYRPPRPGEHDD